VLRRIKRVLRRSKNAGIGALLGGLIGAVGGFIDAWQGISKIAWYGGEVRDESGVLIGHMLIFGAIGALVGAIGGWQAGKWWKEEA
jgi:hypothetical protein